MAQGPGKYDDECTAARLMTGGRMVALVVLNGHHGSGFSVQAPVGFDPLLIAGMLENMARDIRASVAPEVPT